MWIFHAPSTERSFLFEAWSPGGGGLPHPANRDVASPSPHVELDLSWGGMREYTLKDLPQVIENLEEGTLKLCNFPVAGRLRYFYDAWSSITRDLWVLEIIRDGYAPPFIRRPRPRAAPLETPLPTAS